MISSALALTVLYYFTAALAVAVIVMIGRALTITYVEIRDRRLSAGTRAELVIAATNPASDIARLRRIPVRIRIRALVKLARSLTGSELANLRDVAARLNIIRRAERMCRSMFWWRRLYGVRILTILGSDTDVALPLVHDPNALVRAQMAEWLTTRYNDRRIELLLEMVYDPKTICRFSAKDALLRIGEPAVPHVVSRLVFAQDSEALPLLQIAAGIPNARFLEPTLHQVQEPLPEVRSCAAEVLGSIGGQRAADALVRLLDDQVEEVVASAAAALGRIEHWPAAGRLSQLLQAPSWTVRRAAADALRQMGSPGVLMLQRAARALDTPAGAVARFALDMNQTEQLA